MFQYYFFKNEIIEYTTKISSDIEDFTEDEKKKVDAKIVFDSFNDQLRKLERIFEQEDSYNFKEDKNYDNLTS
jgi:hypothetical protein